MSFFFFEIHKNTCTFATLQGNYPIHKHYIQCNHIGRKQKMESVCIKTLSNPNIFPKWIWVLNRNQFAISNSIYKRFLPTPLRRPPRQLHPGHPGLSEDRHSLQMVQTSQPSPCHDVGMPGKLLIDKVHIQTCLQPCRRNRRKREERGKKGGAGNMKGECQEITDLCWGFQSEL